MEAESFPETREPEASRELDWQSVLVEREAQARELIRAHPVAAVLTAAALGFAIARLVRSAR